MLLSLAKIWFDHILLSARAIDASCDRHAWLRIAFRSSPKTSVMAEVEDNISSRKISGPRVSSSLFDSCERLPLYEDWVRFVTSMTSHFAGNYSVREHLIQNA